MFRDFAIAPRLTSFSMVHVLRLALARNFDDMNGYEYFLQYGGVENLPHHEGSVRCGQRPSAALDKRGAITFQKKL